MGVESHQGHDLQKTQPKDGIMEKIDGYISRARGATVPTDGDPGYAVGCEFVDTTGGAGVTLYRNEGSVTSCDFNSI